jgi:L-2-hydroxyglutarate oxidase LhgO
MSDMFDTIVVGAGLVGLAVAKAVSARGRQVLVLERHRSPIQETSSRNSGVLHSGIYYPTGSLKAKLCVRGQKILYDYCVNRQIRHERCGKIIVAQNSQADALAALARRAYANGIVDLRELTAREAAKMEPEVRCEHALFLPSTGIVDTHELAYAYIGDIESGDGSIVYGAEVEKVSIDTGRITLFVRSGDSTSELACNSLVNSAGLDAIPLLRRMHGYPEHLFREPYYAKGSYFSLLRERPFRHLVYPLPNEAGLGIHATLDLDGAVRFGPNVKWIDKPEFSVDAADEVEFYQSVRSYWPALEDGMLQPGYAGVRPKLVGSSSTAADFAIEGSDVHGCRGLVNLLGIESPGLTCSLAIGEFVSEHLD